MQRATLADAYCQGRAFSKKAMNAKEAMKRANEIALKWEKGDNKTIIAALTDRLLFNVSPESQKDFETLLRHDFDPNIPNANQAVLRLFNTIIKEPEFQLI